MDIELVLRLGQDQDYFFRAFQAQEEANLDNDDQYGHAQNDCCRQNRDP